MSATPIGPWSDFEAEKSAEEIWSSAFVHLPIPASRTTTSALREQTVASNTCSSTGSASTTIHSTSRKRVSSARGRESWPEPISFV